MIDNLIQLLVLSILSSLTILYLFIKINIDNTNFTKNNMASFVLLLSGVSVITYKYAGYYKVIINCAIIILLNYVCLKRNFLNSIVNSVLVLIVFSIGDIFSAIVLMNIMDVKLAAIQSNPFFSFLSNILIFISVNIVIFFMKVVIEKIKILRKDRETLVLLAVNAFIAGLLLFISLKTYEYVLLNSSNIDTGYLNFQVVLSLILLFSVSLTTLIIANKYISNTKKFKEILEASKIDKMTDTLNREAGLDLLKDSIEERKRNNNFITICYVDINNLKKVNDNYGHIEGDNLIRKVSDVIRVSLRKTDAVSRLGGDEFLVIFLDCKIDGAKEVLNRIDSKLKELSSGSRYEIGISYGFCEIEPKLSVSLENIIEMADKEMYKIKQQPKENFIEI